MANFACHVNPYPKIPHWSSWPKFEAESPAEAAEIAVEEWDDDNDGSIASQGEKVEVHVRNIDTGAVSIYRATGEVVTSYNLEEIVPEIEEATS